MVRKKLRINFYNMVYYRCRNILRAAKVVPHYLYVQFSVGLSLPLVLFVFFLVITIFLVTGTLKCICF